MNLAQKIESYLFYSGEPCSVKKLAKMFDVSEGEVQDAVGDLERLLDGHALVLVTNGGAIMLATRPEAGELLQAIKKQELSDPLSKAALETLTIILYKDGATKSEIDFIRGVNSGFILRNLLVRGLVEKASHPDDARSVTYRPTFDTLRFLGITKSSELPDFGTFSQEIAKKESSQPAGDDTGVFRE